MGCRHESRNLALAHQLAHKFVESECGGRVHAGDGLPATLKHPSRGVQLEREARVADQSTHGAVLDMHAVDIRAAPGENKRVVLGKQVAALQLPQRAAASTVASFPPGAPKQTQVAQHGASCA